MTHNNQSLTAGLTPWEDNIRVKKRIFTAINMKSIHSWCITGQSVSRCQNQHTWWRQVIKIRLAGMDMCISIYTVISLKSYITHCRSSNKEQTDCRFVFTAQKKCIFSGNILLKKTIFRVLTKRYMFSGNWFQNPRIFEFSRNSRVQRKHIVYFVCVQMTGLFHMLMPSFHQWCGGEQTNK